MARRKTAKGLELGLFDVASFYNWANRDEAVVDSEYYLDWGRVSLLLA